MKLSDIQIGERYFVSRDAPTDLPETLFGMETGRPRRLYQMLQERRSQRRVECEVLAIRLPWKKLDHGVLVRVEDTKTWDWCRCVMCGTEHPADLDPPQEVSFDVTVHYSQLDSLAESVGDFLYHQELRDKIEQWKRDREKRSN